MLSTGKQHDRARLRWDHGPLGLARSQHLTAFDLRGQVGHEAIASRLETIAIRLEAFALRLEAMADRLNLSH